VESKNDIPLELLIPPGVTVEDEVVSDVRSPRNLPAFLTGEVLALPQSFG